MQLNVRNHRILNFVYFGCVMTFGSRRVGSSQLRVVFSFLSLLQTYNILCSSLVIHNCEKYMVLEAACQFYWSAVDKYLM